MSGPRPKPYIAAHENKKTGLRPCLGRGKDHMFVSPNPSRIRICDDCKKARKARATHDARKHLKRAAQRVVSILDL